MSSKPLSILIVPDKFKGSLGATQVAQSIGNGILSEYPAANISYQPMADGGDGSIDLLHELWGLEEHSIQVHDPLFRSIKASYYTGRDEAFVEMAKASGLALLEYQERNCRQTTSLGTGELILDAVKKGFRRINLFIGGSATNDAAIGIAYALGYSFLDKNGELLSPIGGNLRHIFEIKGSKETTTIQGLDIRIVCDVSNPFYGENGAAYVYGPQKGASPEDVKYLDHGLRHLDTIFEQLGFGSVQALAGTGAAGGVGGGMAALFNAKLKAGIDLFIDLFDLEAKIRQADAVITGEGRLDSQSFQGKVVGGVLKLCKQYQKPLWIVCGQKQLDKSFDHGEIISGIYSIMDRTSSVEDAMGNTSKYLYEIGGELGNTI